MLRVIVVTCAMLAPTTALAGWESSQSRGFDYALLETPGVQVRVACDLDATRRGSFFSLSSEKIKARDRLVIGGAVFSAERDGELMVLLKLLDQAQRDNLRSAFAQAARLTVLRGNAGVLEVPLGSSRPAICSKP